MVSGAWCAVVVSGGSSTATTNRNENAPGYPLALPTRRRCARPRRSEERALSRSSQMHCGKDGVQGTWVSGAARGVGSCPRSWPGGSNGGDENEGPKRLGREANTHSSVRMASIASISAAVRSRLAKDGASFDPVVVSSIGPGPFLSSNTTLFPRFFPAASN